MDFDSSASLKEEKLSDVNYHAWKQKIQHVLALKELEDFIEDDPPSAPDELRLCRRKDRKAQATIALSLSDEQLENVRECSTAKQMWFAIQDVFKRHTLLNKLAARRKFYTAEMKETETLLQFSNRIRPLSMTLKSMSVNIDESEMAMALLNGLPDQFHPLISALDALKDKRKGFPAWRHAQVGLEPPGSQFKSHLKVQQYKTTKKTLVFIFAKNAGFH